MAWVLDWANRVAAGRAPGGNPWAHSHVFPTMLRYAAALALGLSSFGLASIANATPRVDMRHRCSDAHTVARVPITLHIISHNPGIVIDAAAWAADELDIQDIRLELSAIEDTKRPRRHTRIGRRRALARLAPPDGTVHVFVVDEIDDYVRDRPGTARGYHWRFVGLSQSVRNREIVLVSHDAPRTTLAHELGHVLGLRHSTGADDLMAHERSGPMVRFSHLQGERMRRGLRRFRRRQVELVRTRRACGFDLRRIERDLLR
jgi:hypothetical protein